MKKPSLCIAFLLEISVCVASEPVAVTMNDFTDPTYGGRIRQIVNPAGNEHNLDHYRCVFNADNSRLLAIETPKGSKDYIVTLYDGDGKFLKRLFTVPREKLRYVRNYHITWPAGVRDWFLLSFFPQTGRLPPKYEPWLDELVQVFVDGRHKILARTGTTCGANFWAQPQQSVSADGSRVLFHSNGTCAVGRIGQKHSGTIDLCLLYLR